MNLFVSQTYSGRPVLLVLCFFDRLNNLVRYPKPYSTLVAYLDLFNLELVLCFGGILFVRPATLNLNKDISLYVINTQAKFPQGFTRNEYNSSHNA